MFFIIMPPSLTSHPCTHQHCLLKDAICPTCHRLTSSSPSLTHHGCPSPGNTLFCSTGRSGGRKTRYVLLSILFFFPYEPSSLEDSQSFSSGNAGSTHKIHSIASLAARQYYVSPYTSSSSLPRVPFHHSISSLVRVLICCLCQAELPFIDYNEVSTFHGSTLDIKTGYASTAITYILLLYLPDMPIVIMGHSMGGISPTLPKHLCHHQDVDASPTPSGTLQPLLV
jgi:hypothetical protein